MLPVEQPFKMYTGLDGKPLNEGYVYFGLTDQNPANDSQRIQVYWDAEGEIPAMQPLRTLGGYISRAGTPANVFLDGDYSILVQDKKARQVFYASTSQDFSIASAVNKISTDLATSNGLSRVGFIQSGQGAVKRDALEKLREQVSLPDFDAEPDVGGNQATAFNNALDRSIAAKIGALSIPRGNWRLTETVTITDRVGIIGEQKTASVVVMEGDGNYGINVNGAGLGGSATDGLEISRLNMWGGKGVALLRSHGTGLFRYHNLTAQNNTKGNVVRFTECQDGALDDFDFLQCGGTSPYSPSDGAVVYYGPGCNNIYSRYARFEAPRNTAIFADGADTIRYIGGKIDGSFGGADLTANPFVVSRNSSISFREFTVTGFKSYPLNVTGYGAIDFSGSIGNGLAPAIFTATTPAYNRFVASGGLPGVINKPSVKFRGQVGFSSTNTTSNIIRSVISLVAPDPLMKPVAGNTGRVQIAGAFDTGGGLFQATIKHWDGGAWSAPTGNDLYTGGWLVDSTTGNVFAQVVNQSGGLVQFRTNGLASTGSEHFIQYDTVHGIRVDIQIDAPSYSASRWNTRLAELKTSVTTTAVSYNGSGYTVVQLSGSVANDSLVGCFLYNKASDTYYYIAANSGAQLTLMHDRSSSVPNGTYEVVVGNPKAGSGIVINWV